MEEQSVYVEDFSDEAYERALLKQKNLPFEISITCFMSEGRVTATLTDLDITRNYIEETYNRFGDETTSQILRRRFEGDVYVLAKIVDIINNHNIGTVMTPAQISYIAFQIDKNVQNMVNENCGLIDRLFFKEWHVNTEVEQLY